MNVRDLLAETGLKSTKARIAVLETLVQSANALSHTEIIERMSGREFDRVTIYRVLDWLTENGLAHKISGDNRAWKFQLTSLQKAHQHAHLQCTACGKITCIHELEPHFPPALLKKYQVSNIEVTLKGICADCAHPNK